MLKLILFMSQGFLKQIEKLIKETDIMIEVIDARFPELTRNKNIESKIKKAKKNFFIVVNKSDLISKKESEKIKQQLKEETKKSVIFISAKQKKGINLIRKEIGIIRKEKKQFNIGLLGYPNSGKSTLINVLGGRGKGKVGTSKKAGFTRGLQKIKLAEGIYLIDAPGIIPYEMRNEFELFLVGAKNPNQLKDPETVAIKLIQKFKKQIEEKIGFEGDEEEILYKIGEQKKFFIKGGKIDIGKTTNYLLNNYENNNLF